MMGYEEDDFFNESKEIKNEGNVFSIYHQPL